MVSMFRPCWVFVTVAEKSRIVNRFTREFIERFCDESGAINWVGLVAWNSGNLDLDQFMLDS